MILCVACSDRYGAYFVVDGKGAVTFDRVEFYFGKELGGALPTSPRHPLPSDEPAVVAKRLFVDTDKHSLTEPTGTFTYYLPDQQSADGLGRYVAVLAYKGDQLVGIGELFDFEVVTGDAVFRYEIDLVDARQQDVELWGRPTADCLRWTRDRGTGLPRSVAVVRDDDTDCDNFLEGDLPNADCLPRAYCDGTNAAACDARVPCLTTSGDGVCQVGTCSNADGATSSCKATTCVDERACSDCDLAKSPAEVIACLVLDNNIHVDEPIVVNPDLTLCAEPFDLDIVLPLDCVNPAILRIEDYMPGDVFTYKIAPATTNTCRLTITPAMAGAHFTAVPHMLITIDTPTGPAARTAFILGLTGVPGPCPTEPSITPQLSFGSCVP